MNKCIDHEIQEMLPDVLHDALDSDARARVEAHLASCESCREELDVLRAVKTAAIFAPSIDVDQVVRQIPPYTPIVPGVERPVRTRVVSWLVAASLALAVAGGGSALVIRQWGGTSATNVASSVPNVPRQATQTPAGVNREPVVPVVTPVPVEPSRARGLALASDVDALSDSNLVQLMNEMDQFDALPGSEPEPVISVDSGDSL